MARVGGPVTHAGVTSRLGAGSSNLAFQPLRLETSAHDGGYAVSFSLAIPLSTYTAGLRVVVDIEVESGAIGIGCMREDFSAFVDVEQTISPGPRRKAYVALGAPGAAKQLMVRNASHHGVSVARVYGIEVLEDEFDDELFGDLDELGQATAKDAPLPFLFCVVSWGCAATQWLANTLNSHPDIFCVHCENQFWERLGGARNLDGWQYLRILGCQSPGSRACGDVHGVSRKINSRSAGQARGWLQLRNSRSRSVAAFTQPDGTF